MGLHFHFSVLTINILRKKERIVNSGQAGGDIPCLFIWSIMLPPIGVKDFILAAKTLKWQSYNTLSVLMYIFLLWCKSQ